MLLMTEFNNNNYQLLTYELITDDGCFASGHKKKTITQLVIVQGVYSNLLLIKNSIILYGNDLIKILRNSILWTELRHFLLITNK